MHADLLFGYLKKSIAHMYSGACQDEDEDGDMASQRARDMVPKVCCSALHSFVVDAENQQQP